MTLSKTPSPPHHDFKPKGKRSLARLWAVKALFQYDQRDTASSDLITEIKTLWMPSECFEDCVYNAVDEDLFEILVLTAIQHREKIDAQLVPLLPQDWSWNRLDPVMRSILRAGCGEACLPHPPPPGVLINEYVDIAAAFSGPSSAGFVNRILDRALKSNQTD